MEIDAIMKLIETDEKVRQQVDNVYDQRQQLKQAIENEKKKLSDERKSWRHRSRLRMKRIRLTMILLLQNCSLSMKPIRKNGGACCMKESFPKMRNKHGRE